MEPSREIDQSPLQWQLKEGPITQQPAQPPMQPEVGVVRAPEQGEAQPTVLEVEKQAPGGMSFTADLGGKDASAAANNPIAQRLQLQEELAAPFAELGLEHSHTAQEFRRQQKLDDKIETARMMRNHMIPQFSDIVFERRAPSGISFVVPGVTQHAPERAPILAQQLSEAEPCIISEEDLRTDMFVHDERRKRHLARRVRIAKRFDTTSARWKNRKESEEKCAELGDQLQLQQEAAKHRRRQLMDRKITKAQMMAGLSRRAALSRSSAPLPKEFDSADKIPRDVPADSAMRSERMDFKLSQTPWDEEQQTTQFPSSSSSSISSLPASSSSISSMPSSSLSSSQQWQSSDKPFSRPGQLPSSSLSGSMAQPRSEMHMGLKQERHGLPEQHNHSVESPALTSRDTKNPFEKLSNNEVQQRQHLHMGISQATSLTSNVPGSSGMPPQPMQSTFASQPLQSTTQPIQSTSQASFPVTDRVPMSNMIDERQRQDMQNMQMGMSQGQGGLQQKDFNKETAPQVQGQSGVMMGRSQARTDVGLAGSQEADKGAWEQEHGQGRDVASDKPRRKSIFGKLKNLLPKRRDSQGGAV